MTFCREQNPAGPFGRIVGPAIRPSLRKDVNPSQRFSEGRRLLFAAVTDTLLEIEGMSERWGKSIFHCSYGHGDELNQDKIGVSAAGPFSPIMQ